MKPSVAPSRQDLLSAALQPTHPGAGSAHQVHLALPLAIPSPRGFWALSGGWSHLKAEGFLGQSLGDKLHTDHTTVDVMNVLSLRVQRQQLFRGVLMVSSLV